MTMSSKSQGIVQPVMRMRFTDEELSVFKNTFAENSDALSAIRKLFLQMPLDPIDQQVIESARKSKELLHVIRKTFLPTLDPKAPPHQLVDLWLTLDIKEKMYEVAYPHMLARQTLLDYLEQQLKFIETGVEVREITMEKLADIKGKDAQTAYCDMLARNTVIGHTEQQIAQIDLLAGMKKETVAETKLRLWKNSNK